MPSRESRTHVLKFLARTLLNCFPNYDVIPEKENTPHQIDGPRVDERNSLSE